jgi:hypothetical protein
MAGPAIARAEAGGPRRHGQGKGAFRTQHSGDLTQCGFVVGNVLEHLAQDRCVEAPVPERK